MRNIDKLNKGDNDPLDFIKKMKPIEAKKDKAQVWAELEEMIAKPINKKAKVRSIFTYNWHVAASIVLFILLGSIASLRFYSKTTDCLPGQQRSVMLPDGSMVQMNSKSTVSYHPYWWKISRKVDLTGEAFFKVKKGEKFTVVSKEGETAVMGTSFNIFARGKDYEVTCFTGKVKVLSHNTNQETIITPNQMVKLDDNGKLNSIINVDSKLAIGWINDRFVFTKTPLNKVLSEISRRYGVAILNAENFTEPYTGNFIKEPNVEVVLSLICKTFNLEYKKLPTGEFELQTTP